ncbi:hypothetical protein ASPWEDRAFT_45890 [Aspergillus wentii DTO 134E9]|uniref:Uncharacterized protein n=1 Tax=Aspergillus wentii DTO 134E9 TaxID=1073089 RepID=A0A1L9R5Z9_ASPWE|nr:uncharacterized protein ASPWEDRAFT_45890 [Aspergillus wentii DTO 134E9]OJJ30340.1 hypothetical protein ASPWEDRAFT_45890 [Aspergillus wentii DTO 134E9]
MTHILQREVTGPIRRLDLPIPQDLAEGIERERQDYIDQIVKSLYGRIYGLVKAGQCCSDCDKLNIGELMKTLSSLEIFPRI